MKFQKQLITIFISSDNSVCLVFHIRIALNMLAKLGEKSKIYFVQNYNTVNICPIDLMENGLTNMGFKQLFCVVYHFD